MSIVNKQKNKTTSGKTSFIINDNEYIFNTFWIEKLKTVNTDVDEDYIKTLLKYLGIEDPNKSPVDISHLLRYDYYNKVIFNSNGGITICQYDFDGNLIKEFSSLDELLEITSVKNSLFGLKSKNGSGLVPKKCKVDFFGTEFTPMYAQKSWRYSYISTLNLWMNNLVECGNKEQRSKVYYENPFCETARKYFSLDDYLIKSKLSFLFSFGGAMHFAFSRRWENKGRRDNLSENEYTDQLSKLLHRYTYKGTSLFHKVENLNDIDSKIGIYIFCLPEVKGYYVGQTTHSFKKRIKNHWYSPKSDFDRYYGHCDVKDVYVIFCNGLNKATINEIETDCIATIGRKFSLNAMAGEDYIISIRDERYNEKIFSTSKKDLEKTLKQLADIKNP